MKSISEWIDALVALSKTPARSREELRAWYRRALELGHATFPGRDAIDVPEVVWHYLIDADIRARDAKYAAWQTAEFEKAIDAMRREPRVAG